MTEDYLPRAVLDADIIYSRVLHELIGRLAAEPLDLFWSEQLLAEAQTALIEKKGLPPDGAQRWVDYMRRNFPVGATNPEHASAPDLGSLTSDPADVHVCALALAAEVDYLFTHDRGYLRDALSDHGVNRYASPTARLRAPPPLPRQGWGISMIRSGENYVIAATTAVGNLSLFADNPYRSRTGYLWA